MCLGSISGDVSASNMKKTGLNGCVYDLSVDYRAFDTRNIIDIHKYLIKKCDINCFDLLKVFFYFWLA